MFEQLASWPVMLGSFILLIVVLQWAFFEIRQNSASKPQPPDYKREYHELLAMLFGEWGGYRLTPGIRINDKRMCAVLTTSEGWLLVKYDQDFEHMLKAVPIYQGGLVNVPLDEEVQTEVIARLLKKSASGMYLMSSYRPDVGLYQSDPIGPNVHDWRGAAPLGVVCSDATPDRPVYEHATSTGFERSGLSHAQRTRACDIRMDDSSAQPEKSPRCMACGEWRSGICKPGGNIVTAEVISSAPVSDGVNRF